MSVILPMRETGGWLRAALDSVDAQESRTEVILVGDGRKGQNADQDVVIGRPTLLQAGTAAEAIGFARGRYLTYLAPGDVYVPEGLDALVEAAVRHSADLVVGDMHGATPATGLAWRRELAFGARMVESVAGVPDILSGVATSNKIFRRDLVRVTRADLSQGALATIPLLIWASRLVLSDRLCCRTAGGEEDPSMTDTEAEIMTRLALAEIIASRCADREAVPSPLVRRAVMRWVGATHLPTIDGAAACLDDAALADFAHRTSIMFKEMPPDVLTEILTESLTVRRGRLDDGLRAVGACRGDAETIRRPVSTGRLRVLAGRVYLDAPELDAFGDLLRVTPLSAVVSRLRESAHSTQVRVHGQVMAPGFLATQGEVRPDLLLEFGDEAARAELQVTKARPGFFAWSCDVPARALPYGVVRLRLIARDRFGAEVAIPLDVMRDGRVRADLETRRVRLRVSSAGPSLVVTRKGPLRSAVAKVQAIGAAMRGVVRR
ncbi:hypothetical protein Pth03_15080 [Planotetraspora thailandica]|uniref:Glycosyltransferase 2-like domain-containing protein n=1 Tax=Planotetraspora thailandica TaxID=487172 RepID=A0A8J3XUC6_9ACTN|nr:hypothetical protein Pth03_15080 [Planotetraspora thailandica]